MNHTGVQDMETNTKRQKVIINASKYLTNKLVVPDLARKLGQEQKLNDGTTHAATPDSANFLLVPLHLHN